MIRWTFVAALASGSERFLSPREAETEGLESEWSSRIGRFTLTSSTGNPEKPVCQEGHSRNPRESAQACGARVLRTEPLAQPSFNR